MLQRNKILYMWNAKSNSSQLHIQHIHFSIGSKPYVQKNLALDSVIEKILINFHSITRNYIIWKQCSFILESSHRFTQIMNYCMLQFLVKTVIKIQDGWFCFQKIRIRLWRKIEIIFPVELSPRINANE